MKISFISKSLKSLSLIAISLSLFSCSLIEKSKTSTKEEVLVATYEGGKITERQIELELKKLASQDPKLASISLKDLQANQKEFLIKEFVVTKASVEQAKKYDLDDEELYLNSFNVFESTILQKQLYQKIAQDAASDEKLQAKYDELVKETADKEDFKLGLILLKNEKEANKTHKRLKRNPKLFSYLVKTKSLDEKSKKDKGIIDYSIESSFPDNIVKIAKNLEKNKISEPFSIADKWAIIKVVDKRKAKIRSFEDSKDSLSQAMALKAVKNFRSQAIKKAQINLILQ